MLREQTQKSSIREKVYEMLKEQILTLKLKPTTKISEQEISKKLNVSRTPVREAFLKLSEEGLLEIVPQSGTIVSKIDLNLVEEGRFVREKLEKAIVVEACRQFDSQYLLQLERNLTLQEFSMAKDYEKMFHLDEEFHNLLFIGCNKRKTWNLIRQMNTQFIRMRMLRLQTTTLDWDIIVKQHHEIFRLITEKKEKEAEDMMEAHLKLVDFEKDQIQKLHPDFFYTKLNSML